MRCSALLLILALPLAACGSGKDATTISINASDDDGNSLIGVSKGGQVSVDVPGFSGKINLPKIQLDADNFDMNGVHLYPGSKITDMNVNAHDKDGAKDDGTVRVSFNSPAATGTVRDWFQDRLGKAGFQVKQSDGGLTGTTDEHKPFRLDLTPDGDAKAKGVITIG